MTCVLDGTETSRRKAEQTRVTGWIPRQLHRVLSYLLGIRCVSHHCQPAEFACFHKLATVPTKNDSESLESHFASFCIASLRPEC